MRPNPVDNGPSPRQIKVIHVLSKVLGQTSGDYQDMLHDGFGVTSSKDLDQKQAHDLVEHLLRLADKRQGGTPGKLPYEELQGRSTYLASPAQLRLIDVLWSQVTTQPVGPDRVYALEKFLRNRFRIGGMSWLKRCDVQKVITAIRAMASQKLNKREAAQEEQNEPTK